MSAVVTTLIIILLTIVALGIIWVVVKNVLDKGSEQISLTGITLDLEIIKVNVEGDNLDVTVKRNPGEGDLTAINFVFSDGDNSVVVRRNTNLDELGWQTFSFSLSTLAVEEITSISIAPVFETESGKEIVGDIIETSEYESGEAGTGGGDDAIGDPNDNPEEPGDTPTECVAILTCETEGYACDEFMDDCGELQNCGTCNSGYNCINNLCVEDTCVPEDNLTACNNAGYECEILSNTETCGEQVNCSEEVLGGTCVSIYGLNYECLDNTCIEKTYVNSGTVSWFGPPGVTQYFSSASLPDPQVANYYGYSATFPNLASPSCYLIVDYNYNPEVYSEVIVELFLDAPVSISVGEVYQIWESYTDCMNSL